MKVKEYIEQFKDLDQEMEILCCDDDGEYRDADYLEIHEEELVKYVGFLDSIHYDSEHYANIQKRNNPRLVMFDKRIYYVIR